MHHMIYCNLQYSEQYGHSPTRLLKKKETKQTTQTTFLETIHRKFSLSCSEKMFSIQIPWKFSTIILALDDGVFHKAKKKRVNFKEKIPKETGR